jgi:hypothetical protein
MKESSILEFLHVLLMFLVPYCPYYLPFRQLLTPDGGKELVHCHSEFLGEFKIKTPLARL